MNFEKLTPDDVKLLAEQGLADPGFFCRTYFPDWFSFKMPWFHRGLLAILSKQTDWLLKFGEEKWYAETAAWTPEELDKIIRHFVWKPEPDDPNSPVLPLFEAERDSKGNVGAIHLSLSNKLLIIAPRGISKTTLVNANNVRDTVHENIDFLVYLSETATHAEQQLDNVSRELVSNFRIQAVYGNKKPERSAPEHWTSKLIETTDGVVIAAKGRGGQVRGMNHMGKRPSRIIFDDVEDKISVKTDEQRSQALSWLKADVEPALPQIGDDRGELIGLGTIIHHDSMLVNLSRDPEWVVVRLGCVDPDGDMLWDRYMTKAQYSKKRQSFVRLGKLAEFNMEYQSSTKSEGDNAKFAGPFVYVPKVRSDFVGVGLVCDPAISEKKGSDFCSFGVVGMNDKGMMHVLDFYAEVGMSPRQQVDKFFELHFRWEPTKHGVEAVAYQKALIHLLREEMFRKGKQFGPKSYFHIEPILHGKTGKIERVEGILSPRFAAGYVTLQRRFPILEEQLLDWPNAKKDGPDVIAMTVSLLDPYAALALEAEDDGTNPHEKNEFPPLEEELGLWRTAP